MEKPYQITDLREEPGLGADGKAAPMIRVAFTAGGLGPFFEQFPKATFSAFAVQQRLEAFVRELETLRS